MKTPWSRVFRSACIAFALWVTCSPPGKAVAQESADDLRGAILNALGATASDAQTKHDAGIALRNQFSQYANGARDAIADKRSAFLDQIHRHTDFTGDGFAYTHL